jgi:hypothetical protein
MGHMTRRALLLFHRSARFARNRNPLPAFSCIRKPTSVDFATWIAGVKPSCLSNRCPARQMPHEKNPGICIMQRPSETKENPGSHFPANRGESITADSCKFNSQKQSPGHGSIKAVFFEHVRSEVVTGNQIAIGATGYSLLRTSNERSKIRRSRCRGYPVCNATEDLDCTDFFNR